MQKLKWYLEELVYMCGHTLHCKTAKYPYFGWYICRPVAQLLMRLIVERRNKAAS